MTESTKKPEVGDDLSDENETSGQSEKPAHADTSDEHSDEAPLVFKEAPAPINPAPVRVSVISEEDSMEFPVKNHRA